LSFIYISGLSDYHVQHIPAVTSSWPVPNNTKKQCKIQYRCPVICGLRDVLPHSDGTISGSRFRIKLSTTRYDLLWLEDGRTRIKVLQGTEGHTVISVLAVTTEW